MTSLDPAQPPEILPADLVEAGTYATADAGFEHGLVVLATGNSCWLVPDERGHHLLIEPREAVHIRGQLAKFDRESVGWPPRPVVPPRRRVDTLTPVVWVLVATAMFWLEASRPQTVDWLDLDRTAVLTRHEWWRPLTALFLHADVGHVISNLVSGAFVFSAVTTTLGRRRGWLLLGIAAVVGNVISVLCHPGEYRSLGASTAIFGALGLLTGHAIAWARGLAPGQRWQAAMLPLVSGIVVLALYGAGGPTIDVGAHVCGFVCGALLGPFATHGSVRSGDSSD